MATTTTVCIKLKVKERLDSLKFYKGESYNSVIERLVAMAFDDEPLSEEEIRSLEASLEDIKAGRIYSSEDVWKEIEEERNAKKCIQ
jgi:predicted transcriptional regulator